MSRIPIGCKQTEVGVIPEEWEICEFQDVMTGFASGATPYRGKPEYYKGDIKWVTSGELNYCIINDTNEKITNEAVLKTNLKILPIGTFLFAITGLEAEGTRGSCGILGTEATTNQSCMALFPKKDLLTTSFLYHYYVWQGNNLAIRYCQGTKQQSYTGKIAKKLPIIVPSNIEEQEAIAGVLSDADALIEATERLIAKKRLVKQGAMQHLLTPKPDWKTYEFQEVMTGFTSGATPYRGKPEYYKGNIKWVTSGELNYCVIKDTNEKITTEAVINTNLRILPIGTFLFAITGLEAAGTRGSCGILGVKAATNQSCMALFPKKDLLVTDYLYHYYIWQGNNLALQYCQGTKQQSYTGKIAKKLPISLPLSIAEQTRIASILSDMDEEIRALESKLSKYRQIKEAMMQNLLTGKVRLV